MMKRVIVRPACFRALILSNSEYSEESKLNSIPQSYNDASKVRECILELLKFDEEDVAVIRNKKAEEIKEKVDKFITKKAK
jgi:hypothetical protein